MSLAYDVGRLGPWVVVLGVVATSACFTTEDAPPLVPETTTGGTPGSTGGETSGTPVTSTTASSQDGGSSDDATTGPPPGTTGSVETTDTGDESTGPVPAVCGDGIFDPGTEECDDGNRESGDLCSATCTIESLVFEHTGAPQTYDVPDWVDSLVIEAWGAQGGGAPCCEPPSPEDGGRGGYVSGTLPTIGGVTLTINVGGQGQSQGAGGFNGGGAGGTWGAGGGGATDVRIGAAELDNRLLVAGGGGGGNCGCPDAGTGGDGGGLMGAPGVSNWTSAPGGGSQMAGGAAGENGTPGVLGTGGSSANPGDTYHFGGGGGGLYGGGGGYGSGGGGGSSYLGLLEDGVTMPGMREGHGELIITPVPLR